jgi:hypothetical protein
MKFPGAGTGTNLKKEPPNPLPAKSGAREKKRALLRGLGIHLRRYLPNCAGELVGGLCA